MDTSSYKTKKLKTVLGKCSHFLFIDHAFSFFPAEIQHCFVFNGYGSQRFDYWMIVLMWSVRWTGRMGVYFLLGVQVLVTVCSGHQQTPQFIAARLMFKQPLTLNLQPRFVCVCLCQGHDWPALWPQRWVMCCLVWRLRTNKHSALFYSMLFLCSFCGVHRLIFSFTLIVVLKTRQVFIKHLRMLNPVPFWKSWYIKWHLLCL